MQSEWRVSERLLQVKHIEIYCLYLRGAYRYTEMLYLFFGVDYFEILANKFVGMTEYKVLLSK